LEVLEELGIVCRVGHPAKIRAAKTRKQKHDRRDARLMLDLLMKEDGFPEIWMPSSEQRDLRTLLRDRQQWVKIRTRVQNTLQAMALNHALRRHWLEEARTNRSHSADDSKETNSCPGRWLLSASPYSAILNPGSPPPGPLYK
jgi:hypothetical protein